MARALLIPWSLMLASMALIDAVNMRGAPHNSRKQMTLAKAPHRKRCSLRHVALVDLAAAGAKTNFTGVAKSPGTGMNTTEIESQFADKVTYKDGYYNIDCIKDYMYYNGDKFGDNKYSYELEKTAQVSVVFPLSYVPKEDRKPMTVDYCYSLCRQLKSMVFFGIVNGRDCYCTPYVKAMAGDDSVCSAPCEGDKGEICGSKTKSMVFQMHSCYDYADKLSKAIDAAGDLIGEMSSLSGSLDAAGSAVDVKADTMKAAFGQIGDPEVSNLFQASEQVGSALKVWAGKLEALKGTMTETKGKAETQTGKDFGMATVASEADSLMASMAEEATMARKFVAEGTQYALSVAPAFTGIPVANGTAAQYYPIMYFVDKKFNATPTSCSGKLMATYVGVSKDGCAAACDSTQVEGCMGFLFVPGKEDELGTMPSSYCFTFSGITGIQYYTKEGCPASEVMCYGKLSKLAGTSPLDKEKGQKAVKAERCMPVTV